MLTYQFMCCSTLKLCSPAAALSAGISRNTGPEAKRKEKLHTEGAAASLKLKTSLSMKPCMKLVRLRSC